jgi:uncharacterized glyoxalase superfamily protein PhnB
VEPNRSVPGSAVIPVLIYPDVREAVGWLCAAFGFTEQLRVGENHRSQLTVGEGAVIVGDVRGDRRPPRPGEVTHAVMIRVDDASAHCERARAYGARILTEPTDLEFGERQYTVEDLAGHQWTFSQTLVDVAPESWGGDLVAPSRLDVPAQSQGAAWGTAPEPEEQPPWGVPPEVAVARDPVIASPAPLGAGFGHEVTSAPQGPVRPVPRLRLKCRLLGHRWRTHREGGGIRFQRCRKCGKYRDLPNLGDYPAISG